MTNKHANLMGLSEPHFLICMVHTVKTAFAIFRGGFLKLFLPFIKTHAMCYPLQVVHMNTSGCKFQRSLSGAQQVS